jgi:hypothetical protein
MEIHAHEVLGSKTLKTRGPIMMKNDVYERALVTTSQLSPWLVGFFAALLVMGCGQAPAFDEQIQQRSVDENTIDKSGDQVGVSGNPDSSGGETDATSGGIKGGPDGSDGTTEADNNSIGNGGNTVGDGGNTVGDGGNTVGDGGNTVGDGGNTVSNGGNTVDNGRNTVGNSGNTVGNGGNTAGSGGSSNGGGANPSSGPTLPDGGQPAANVLVEDGGSLVIPGAKVQRVGINFEDLNDFDYNDAVLCFEGNFKIEGTNVISYQNQTVTARTFSASGCQHRIDVAIIHKDGTRVDMNYRSNSGQTLQLPFGIESHLEVTMTVIGGSCSRTPISMHNTLMAIVKPDVCNTFGG